MYGHSDKGMKRPGNEDSFYCSSEEGILIVADGMGGHASGEVASALAVRIIRDRMLRAFDERKLSNETPDEDWLCRVIRNSIASANSAIFEKTASISAKQAKMGTTVVLFTALEGLSAVAHVGDSRVYLLRSGKLFQMTQDHSLVHEQLRASLITEEEAKKSIYRHIVTRALGMREEVEAEVQPLVVREGDLILLCSDGLFDLVEDEAIQDLLVNAGDSLGDAAHKLIDLANARGGEDNITVVLAKVD